MSKRDASRERSIKKKTYQKPEYHLEKTMTFMFDGIKKKPLKITCRQCSSCHGCR